MKSLTDSTRGLTHVALIILLVVAILVLASLFALVLLVTIKIIFPDLAFLNLAEPAILFVTAVVVSYYTLETKRLREISQRQTKEIETQTQLQLTPLVGLDTKQGQGAVLSELCNVGNGAAVNIEFDHSEIKKYHTMGIMIAGKASKEFIPIRLLYQAFDGQAKLKKKPICFTITYEDVNKTLYFTKQTFDGNTFKTIGTGKMPIKKQ